MEITVRFQGIIADMIGRKSDRIALAEGATVADLLTTLSEDDKTIGSILKQTRAFIDGKQADRDAALANGSEVIFMRPIAGG
jgi:molybdopterin converting factor small subunit